MSSDIMCSPSRLESLSPELLLCILKETHADDLLTVIQTSPAMRRVFYQNEKTVCKTVIQKTIGMKLLPIAYALFDVATTSAKDEVKMNERTFHPMSSDIRYPLEVPGAEKHPLRYVRDDNFAMPTCDLKMANTMGSFHVIVENLLPYLALEDGQSDFNSISSSVKERYIKAMYIFELSRLLKPRRPHLRNPWSLLWVWRTFSPWDAAGAEMVGNMVKRIIAEQLKITPNYKKSIRFKLYAECSKIFKKHNMKVTQVEQLQLVSLHWGLDNINSVLHGNIVGLPKRFFNFVVNYVHSSKSEWYFPKSIGPMEDILWFIWLYRPQSGVLSEAKNILRVLEEYPDEDDSPRDFWLWYNVWMNSEPGSPIRMSHPAWLPIFGHGEWNASTRHFTRAYNVENFSQHIFRDRPDASSRWNFPSREKLVAELERMAIADADAYADADTDA